MKNKIPNPKTSIPYWDDGQAGPNYYRWYKKGWWKRYTRKRFLRKINKEYEKGTD